MKHTHLSEKALHRALACYCNYSMILFIIFICIWGGVNAPLYGQGTQTNPVPNYAVHLIDNSMEYYYCWNPAEDPDCPFDGCWTTCEISNFELIVVPAPPMLLNTLFEYVICPQFIYPSWGYGSAELGNDGCWHFWTSPDPATGLQHPLNNFFDEGYFSENGQYALECFIWANNDHPDPFPDDQDGNGTLDKDDRIAGSSLNCIEVLHPDTFDPQVTISPEPPYCLETPITFAFSSPPNYSYSNWTWTLPDGSTGNIDFPEAEEVTITPQQAGWHNMTLSLQLFAELDNCGEILNFGYPFYVSGDVCCGLPPDGVLCCMLEANDDYLHFDPAGNIVPPGTPGATLDRTFNAPGVATWSPGVGNHPFGVVQGTPTNPIRINGDLIFEHIANTEVIIQNLHFEFGPKGRIIVKPRATLTLRGAVLNGNLTCQTMWQGIRALGPGNNINSDGNNTGRVHIEPWGNATQINDAIVGFANTMLPFYDLQTLAADVDVFDDMQTTFINPSSLFLFLNLAEWITALNNSGGYIRINTPSNLTQFNDCFIGSHLLFYTGTFLPDQNGYMFNGARFETQGNMAYPLQSLSSETGIMLTAMKKNPISIQNCHFEGLGYGIRANVVPSFSAADNIFDQCRHGISARNFTTGNNDYIGIKANTFNQCPISIQGDGIVTGISNNYLWGDETLIPFEVGIFLRASFFQVANNGITDNEVGIAVVESDQNGNDINNNAISSSIAGIYLEGDNTGVQMFCNDIIDYFVGGIFLANSNANPGLLDNQGNCDNEPAANLLLQAANATDLVRGGNTQGYVYSDVDIPGQGITASPGIVLENCLGFWESRDVRCGFVGMVSPEEIAGTGDETRKNTLTSRLIRQYKEAQNFEAAWELLQSVQTRMCKRKQAEAHNERGETAVADALLESMERVKPEDDNFYGLQKILLTLQQNGKDVREMDADQEAMLLEIAQSRTQTAYCAQTLLYLARGYEYPVQLPDFSEFGITGYDYTSFKASNNTMYFSGKIGKIFPNPATENINIAYRLEEGEVVTIKLFDSSGRLCMSQELSGSGVFVKNTSNLQPGLYFCEGILNGDILLRDKFAVVE